MVVMSLKKQNLYCLDPFVVVTLAESSVFPFLVSPYGIL